MIASVSRPKLASGWSYVLKTSQLADALAAAGIGWRFDLVYWSPRAGGSILEGHYWPPNENLPHPRVYVRAGSVPSALLLTVAEVLRESALPQFIRWVEGLVALPEGSPALAREAYFNATFTVDGLAFTDQPLYRIPKPGL